MSFEMYGQAVDSVSCREWWGWQESIFGNVFGWTPAQFKEIIKGNAAGKEKDGAGIDVMRILSFGSEDSEKVPFPEKGDDDYHGYDADETSPKVSDEAFSQLEREIGLGLLWQGVLGLGYRGSILPERGESIEEYSSRVQEIARSHGIEHAIEAYRCGVPINDIMGNDGLDASDMHYHRANWTIWLG